MRRTRQPALKSSRVGSKLYKTPPPLRFQTVKDAKDHIRANKMKVQGHMTHSRGYRIHVLTADGKTRTISIPITKKKEE